MGFRPIKKNVPLQRGTLEWSQTINKGRFDPVVFAEKLLGLDLHDGQRYYLRNCLKYKHYMLCPANQFGKSFIVAVLHIWANFYKWGIPSWDTAHKIIKYPDHWSAIDTLLGIDYQTLNLSPRMRQTKLVYKYILDILTSRFTWQSKRINQMYSKLKWKTNKCLIPDFLYRPERVPHDQSLSTTPIEFNFRPFMRDKEGQPVITSRLYIASTSHDKGASIAGDQFALISYDECALSNYLEDELGNYIWSRLVKFDGKLHLVSTPDADSDSSEYFQFLVETAKEESQKEDSDWGYQGGRMEQNLFLDKLKILRQKDQMKKFNPSMYQQIFEGRIVGSTIRFFSSQDLDNFFDEKVNFLEAQSGHTYVIGADFAVAHNFTVYIVLDVTQGNEWYVVHMERFKGEKYPPNLQLEILANLSREYNMAEVVYDASSLAGPFIEYSNFLNELYTYPNKFDALSKMALLVALKKVLGYNGVGKIRAPLPSAENRETIGALRRELSTYHQKDRKKIKDCVMALGLCAWRMEEMEKGGEVSQTMELDFLAA